MKRIILSLAIALMAGVSAQAQCCKSEKKEKVTVVNIEDNNIFSQCFKNLDTNNDGVVDCCEAKKATFLSLERGGRSNVIDNYDFLKYFPNLTALGLGNTPLEIVDLHYQEKLEKLHVGNAAWLKKVIVGGDKAPEISGVSPDRDPVQVIFYKEYAFTVSEPVELVPFADEDVKEFCLRNKKIDSDKDGHISIDEAKAVTRLSLMNFKSFIRNIKSYEDLKFFPNLEYFHAGMTYVETLDVSCCPKLKELDLSDCRMLKTIILAKGCKPEIKYPVAYKGEQAKIDYK